jgi:hypothetical protein
VSANYRYWCGECRYRTGWLTESQGAEQQERHHDARHPDVAPGGRVEIRQRASNGIGCLGVVGVLFLILLLASTCQKKATSAPMPTVAACDPTHIRGCHVFAGPRVWMETA